MRILGVRGALEIPEELWSAFKTTVLDVAGGCVGTHHKAKKNYVSQGTLDTIDQSCRARLNGRAELFRELRRKTLHALRLDKEACLQGICDGVEHHLWSSDSRPAYRRIHALHFFKPIPQCTAIREEGGRHLTEESKVSTCPPKPVTDWESSIMQTRSLANLSY